MTKLDELTRATLQKAYADTQTTTRHAEDIKQARKEAADRYGPDHPITRTLGDLHERTQEDLLSRT